MSASGAKSLARLKTIPKSARKPGNQDPNGPLSEMQSAFVKHLVHDQLTQTAAARMAGFKNPNVAATNLVRNPKIIKAIAEARAEYALASGMTKQKVIDGFLEAVDLARIKGEPMAMVAGWREVGKMCGFYEPQKSEIKLSVHGAVLVERMSAMSDDELLRILEQDPQAIEGEFTNVE